MILAMIGLGTLRFLLAIAVLFLHADYVPFEVAQIAVLTFFFISGAMMERAYSLYTAPWRFLLNRALRLIPGFFLVAIATWGIIALSSDEFRTSFGYIYLRPALTIAESALTAEALTAIEVDGTIPYLGFASDLVPQSWSIGNELLYYLSIPGLALLGVRTLGLLLLSSAIFLGIQLTVRFDDFDYLTYTNALATYFFFILGYFVSRSLRLRSFRLRERTLLSVRATALLLICTSYLFDFPDSISPQLVITSVLVLSSLITIGFLTHEREFDGRTSHVLGRLSYPLYLSHMLAIGLLNAWSLLNVVNLLILSTLLAALLHRIAEVPIDRLRGRVRKQKAPFRGPFE